MKLEDVEYIEEDLIEEDPEKEELTEENLTEEEQIIEQKEEKQKQKISQLYIKLEELQEKLANEELSPMKRFLIENKLSIIKNRLERELAKMDIEEYKKEYEANKDEMYELHNEELQEKQEELNSIFEEIEDQERLIEQKIEQLESRKADYEEINKATRVRGNKREVYQFNTDKMGYFIQEQEEILEKLEAKKDLKKEEIINFKKEFIENEKRMDSEFSQQIKEYKPSIWQTIKASFKDIANNFANWRRNSKEEKEAVKNAKNQARLNTRTGQSIDSAAQNRERAEDFKDRVNYYIPLDEQKEYSEKAQEELEYADQEMTEDKIQE